MTTATGSASAWSVCSASASASRPADSTGGWTTGSGSGRTVSGSRKARARDYWDLSLGLNVHLTPKGAVDWYAGPFVGYSVVDGHESLVVDRSLEYDAKGGLTWGVQTGLDWPFGDSPWSLHVGGRYTRYAADPDLSLHGPQRSRVRAAEVHRPRSHHPGTRRGVPLLGGTP